LVEGVVSPSHTKVLSEEMNSRGHLRFAFTRISFDTFLNVKLEVANANLSDISKTFFALYPLAFDEDAIGASEVSNEELAASGKKLRMFPRNIVTGENYFTLPAAAQREHATVIEGVFPLDVSIAVFYDKHEHGLALPPDIGSSLSP